MNALQKIAPAQTAPTEAPDLRLVADRDRVYPMSVAGPVRNFKWEVLVLCLSIYYILPWLRWDRGIGRPNQALLLDIWNERMYVLDWEFWPQDIYLLAGAMILAAIALFMVTSLIGRVWCGYTCPQTVWTDLFLRVERIIEGDRNERMKRDAEPLSWDKVWRKAAKHSIWLGVAFWTGGAWIMYYSDAPTITHAFWTGSASFQVYFFTGLFTATTYVLAGWAREQVCTYMCPWPRFQAAMLDEQTLTVTYQAWRGEPRGKKHQDETWQGRGDCVDCNACVHVCPTGIDIRDGQQLECINCGLCVDACNGVMTKLERPNGLITWDNLARQSARIKKLPVPPIRFVRARTLIYFGLVLLGAGGMAFAVTSRSEMSLIILRDRAPLFVRLADGDLRNGYTLSIINKKPTARTLQVSLKGIEGAQLALPENGVEKAATVSLSAKPDTVTDVRVLVRAPASTKGRVPVTFVLRDALSGATQEWPSTFIAPQPAAE